MAHFYGDILPFVIFGSFVTCGVSAGAFYIAHTLEKDPKRAASNGLILSFVLMVCTLPCCGGLLNVALICAVLSTIAMWRLRKVLHAS